MKVLFPETVLFVFQVDQLLDDRPARSASRTKPELRAFGTPLCDLDAAVRSFFDLLHDTGRDVMSMDINGHSGGLLFHHRSDF